MNHKITLFNYLQKKGLDGIIVTPFVRDMLQKYKDDVDISNFNDLSVSTQVGVIRAFRYTTDEAIRKMFLTLICGLPSPLNEAVLNEISLSVRSFIPITPEETLLITQFYDNAKQTYPIAGICSNTIKTEGFAYKEMLRDETRNTFSSTDEICQKIKDYARNISGIPDEEVIETEKAPSDIIICQISDIHFGKYYAYGKAEMGSDTLKGPMHDLGSFLKNRCKVEPDFFVICGDIASDKPDDFKHFEEFYRKLNIPLEKILIVPGNHDNFWTEHSNDNLKAFQEYFASTYNTPFGGKITDCIYDASNAIPAALYIYRANKIVFLLLTSTFYTGMIQKEIAEVISKAGGNDLTDELTNKIRFEYGYYDESYIPIIENLICVCRANLGEKYEEFAKIAVCHHHFVPVYDDEKISINSEPLLQALKEYGFMGIMHGHIHRAPAMYGDRMKIIPAPAFSGKCAADGNGMNIVKINQTEMRFESVKVYNFEGGRWQTKVRRDLTVDR